MTPTAEQRAIIEAARSTTQNLIVTARAGAAKTTTLCLLAEALKGSVLCIAFNKAIQLELVARLPAGASAKTMNAIGYKALFQYYRMKSKIDSSKMFNIVKGLADELTDRTEKLDMMDNIGDYLAIIRKARQVGYVPEGIPGTRRLYSLEETLDSMEEIPSELQLEVMDTAIRRSHKLMLTEGLMDFDDQIYWPAVTPSITFETADNILVDEAQDLSPLNHEILRRMARRSRVIAVGDPAQAIYGFRGADAESMPNLKQLFEMDELSLTICFRSDEAIVKEAHFRAPDMQWRNDAGKGLVERVQTWKLTDLQQGDAVICRNNAPLFSLALKLLRAGIYAELASGDIVKGLMSKMKKLGKPSDPAAEVLGKLDEWATEMHKKNKNSKTIDDQRECIELFLSEAETLGDALKTAEQLMTQTGRVKLMTGHKSKGLEFNRVWFLEQHLVGKEGQDPNIRYVIVTRARNELRYIDMKGLVEE